MPQSQLPASQSHYLSHPTLPIRIAQGETGGAPAEGAHTGTVEKAEHAEKHQPGEIPDPNLLIWNSFLVAACMILFALAVRGKLSKIPRGATNLAEMIAEGMNNFTVGIIGHGGEKYTPLVGTVGVYIFLMNLIGIIPGFHSPTSNVTVTLALGVVVFLYVQYEGIRANGVWGYFKHFMGPMPALAPLMLPVELISECVKPFTLAIRLFGNIFGEDVILVVIAGLGAGFGASFLPLHFPIILLSLLTDAVQALVFSILTCIYLSLATHHDHGDEHAEDDIAHAVDDNAHMQGSLV